LINTITHVSSSYGLVPINKPHTCKLQHCDNTQSHLVIQSKFLKKHRTLLILPTNEVGLQWLIVSSLIN